jgi:hypothetical protein
MLKADRVAHLQSLGMHEMYRLESLVFVILIYLVFEISKRNMSLHLSAVKVFVRFQQQTIHDYGNMLTEKELILNTTSRERVKQYVEL